MSDTTRIMKRQIADAAQPDKTMMERILFWKLAMTKVVIAAFIATANSIITSLNGVNWDDFSSSQKLTAKLNAIIAAGTVIAAFLDSTMHELKNTQDDLKKIASETTFTETDTNIRTESKT